MEWSKVDVAPRAQNQADRPVNWLQFDGVFLRAAVITSLTVSIGWAVAILLTLGYFQATVLGGDGNAANADAPPLSAALVFLVVPLYGLWMAGRALRDSDDVLAIVALMPLHLLAIPASAMIAIDATSFVVTAGGLLSLIGNIGYVALVWAENRAWSIG